MAQRPGQDHRKVIIIIMQKWSSSHIIITFWVMWWLREWSVGNLIRLNFYKKSPQPPFSTAALSNSSPPNHSHFNSSKALLLPPPITTDPPHSYNRSCPSRFKSSTSSSSRINSSKQPWKITVAGHWTLLNYWALCAVNSQAPISCLTCSGKSRYSGVGVVVVTPPHLSNSSLQPHF